MLEQHKSAAPEPIAAESGTSRILGLDVLRGVALFGILLVNMRHFSTPALYAGGASQAGSLPVDRLVDGLIFFFAQGKFFPLFSFLFGLGLVLQLQRWRAKGAPSSRLFLRRLAILLIIGLLHGTLIWAGDILAKYAVLGLLFLVLLPLPPRVLLGGAGALLMVPIMLNGLGVEGLLAGVAGYPTTPEGLKAMAEQSLAVYGSGSFAEMTRQRLLDLGYRLVNPSYFSGLFTILGMFCLGAFAGQRGLFHPPVAGRFRMMLVVGLGGFALSMVGFIASRFLPMLAAPPVLKTLNLVGNLSMTAMYIAAVVLVLERASWRERLAPLASAGRMALTNYLLQSLLATAIFYGLGYYGRLGSAACLGITLAIFGIQVVASRLWLERFRFGPLEWLWRWGTYGKRPAMRR